MHRLRLLYSLYGLFEAPPPLHQGQLQRPVRKQVNPGVAQGGHATTVVVPDTWLMSVATPSKVVW